MKETIEKLKSILEDVKGMKKADCEISCEYMTMKETRQIIVSSVYDQALNNIEGCIKQLEIIEQFLY